MLQPRSRKDSRARRLPGACSTNAFRRSSYARTLEAFSFAGKASAIHKKAIPRDPHVVRKSGSPKETSHTEQSICLGLGKARATINVCFVSSRGQCSRSCRFFFADIEQPGSEGLNLCCLCYLPQRPGVHIPPLSFSLTCEDLTLTLSNITVTGELIQGARALVDSLTEGSSADLRLGVLCSISWKHTSPSSSLPSSLSSPASSPASKPRDRQSSSSGDSRSE